MGSEYYRVCRIKESNLAVPKATGLQPAPKHQLGIYGLARMVGVGPTAFGFGIRSTPTRSSPWGKSLSRGDRIRTCGLLVPNQALYAN